MFLKKFELEVKWRNFNSGTNTIKNLMLGPNELYQRSCPILLYLMQIADEIAWNTNPMYMSNHPNGRFIQYDI